MINQHKKISRINRLGENKSDGTFKHNYSFVFSDDPEDWLNQNKAKRPSEDSGKRGLNGKKGRCRQMKD